MKLRFPISAPRAADGTLLPAGLLAVLVTMIAAQLALTSEPELPDAQPGRAARTEIAADLPGIALPPVLTGRPLFVPGRTLAAAAGGPSAAPLAGAVVAGSLRQGRVVRLFLKEPDGTIRTLAPGGTYQGWRLAGVGSDSATFVQAGQRISIAFGSAMAIRPEAAAGEDSDEEQ